MKNLFDKSELAIDLTSLLDVIFIVLLVVMCRQSILTEAQSDATNEAENSKTQSDAERSNFKQHEEKYDNIDDYVLFIDVTSKYAEASIDGNRTMSIISGLSNTNTSAPLDVISYTTEEEDNAYIHLKEILESEIEKGKKDNKVIILSLNKNDEDILYRDEIKIEKVFDEMCQNNDDVYLR